jgi:trimethylamine--corrinoid protein Co-methyltransferase
MHHMHTVKHLRQSLWLPYVVSHESYEQWEAGGAKDYATRAREYAKELLRSHQPQSLADDTDAKLRELCSGS